MVKNYIILTRVSNWYVTSDDNIKKFNTGLIQSLHNNIKRCWNFFL
jgi:hypothetical protein